jgi:hypothetical protein
MQRDQAAIDIALDGVRAPIDHGERVAVPICGFEWCHGVRHHRPEIWVCAGDDGAGLMSGGA